MFSSVHHIAIICSNFEISKDFYTRILGFQIIRETFREDRKSWKLDLRLSDEIQIELFSFPATPVRLSHPEACGLRHLAFRVRDLKRVLSHLETHAVAFEPPRTDEQTGKRFTFFSDPDGLPLEIYEEPSISSPLKTSRS